MLEKVAQKKKPVGLLNSTQLFVGGIPNDVHQDEIVRLFSSYGRLKKVVMPVEKGRNRGFAFVTYDNCESVNAVFGDLKNVRIRAKELDVKEMNRDKQSRLEGDRFFEGGKQGRPAFQSQRTEDTTLPGGYFGVESMPFLKHSEGEIKRWVEQNSRIKAKSATTIHDDFQDPLGFL